MDKREIKKREIIEASIRLMHYKGYNGTSVKDITDAAGKPKGTFYNYFDSKEDYAVEALKFYYYEMVNENIDILTDTSLLPLERIVKFYDVSIEAVYNQEKKLGCFIGKITQEMGSVNQAITDMTEDLLNNIVLKIHTNLLEAKEDGSFIKSVDLLILSNFIVNSWQGTLLRMKVSSNEDILREFKIMLENDLLK